MSDAFEVLIVAYPARETAGAEFDQLVELIRTKEVRSEGAILVERDESGEVQVRETGDHLGRKGTGWGGGVGVLVGCSPRRCSAPSRSARLPAGSSVKFTQPQAAATSIGDGSRREPQARHGGGHGGDRHAESGWLSNGPWQGPGEVGGADRGRRNGRPQGRARRAHGQVQPGPHGAAHRRPGVRRLVAARWRSRSGDWTIVAGTQAARERPERAARPDRRRRLRRTRDLRRAHPTPNLTRVQDMGLTYNRFHVTAVCSPTRAALLTGRNHHRVGMGSSPSSPRPTPATPGRGPAAARRSRAS